MTKKAASSNSFVQNVFRGMVDPTQMFPYPVAGVKQCPKGPINCRGPFWPIQFIVG